MLHLIDGYFGSKSDTTQFFGCRFVPVVHMTQFSCENTNFGLVSGSTELIAFPFRMGDKNRIDNEQTKQCE